MLTINVYLPWQDVEGLIDSDRLDAVDGFPISDNWLRVVTKNSLFIDVRFQQISENSILFEEMVVSFPSGRRVIEFYDLDQVMSSSSDQFFTFPDGARIFLSDADDIVSPSSGDDNDFQVFGNQLADMGGGYDELISYFPRADVYVDTVDDGVFLRSPDGNLTKFRNLEKLTLADGAYLFDLDGEDLPYIYRLYDAAYARTPDEDGLRFWLDAVDDGFNPDNLAEEFVTSDEFARLFGRNPSDEAFVNALYRNVLRRDADPQGLDFWTDVFASGAQTRADMLEHFAESPENVARNTGNLDDGVWVI